jgi:hypothetical protein
VSVVILAQDSRLLTQLVFESLLRVVLVRLQAMLPEFRQHLDRELILSLFQITYFLQKQAAGPLGFLLNHFVGIN